MKCLPYLAIALSLLVGLWPAGAQPSMTPAGHWEGAITLPGTELGIRVDLEKPAQTWAGSIDIPVQGLRGFKLAEVVVKGAEVSFAMPGVPGDPKFAGSLASDANSIAGDFTQGGQQFRFKLERKSKPVGAGGETPAHGVAGKGLAGFWQSSLRPSAILELRLVLELTNSPAGRPGGVLISVDQGNARVPVTALTESNGTVHLEVNSIRALFDGKLSADGSELVGDWQQGAGKLPLTFKRLAKAPLFGRVQEPSKPYPYEEEEILVANPAAGIQLAGTFTRPRGPGPHPAVVLVSGSGPQDRDEAIMGHRPFLVLADHLTRRGIAVLRYDDRGVGKSTGNFGTATHEDFVTDALAAVDWLARKDGVDPKRIGLVGHSEGGIVAPLAAVNRPMDIAFLVLLAGVGVPMEELLVRQGEDILRVMGGGADAIARSAAAQRETFRLLKETQDPSALEPRLRELVQRQLADLTDEQRQALGYSDTATAAQIQAVLTPWFRRLLVYDPRPTLRKVKCPVLALNGEKDLQVAAKDNLPAIRDALAQGGNQDVKTIELPGLNHLFQTGQTGAVAEYGQIEETFNLAALNAVSDWIRQRTGLR